ncbi:unnamed protein product [Rotaria magnacalcarata]
MNQIFIFILLIGFISQRVYSQRKFNTTAYALSRPCLWSSCNVTGYSIGNPAYILDCCALQLPLNYAQPNQTIPISMSRLSLNQTNQSQNTIVMLSGEPVSKWGTNGLNQFSITNTAHDVSIQIESYEATNPGRVCLFAVSYETLSTDRFLQMYPTVVQASVMDGVFGPLTSSDSRAPLLTNVATIQFQSYCRLQIKCNQYFSAKESPVDVLKTILNQILRSMFLDWVTDAGRYFDRTIVPAVIYCLNRCNANDVTVLKFFFQNTAAITAAVLLVILFSSVLSYNIVQSEIWLAMNETEIDETTYDDWRDSTIMTLTRPSNFFKF